MQWNIATYVARGSPYTRRLLKIRGPAHKVNELDGCQNARTRAAPAVSMEENEKTSVLKARWHTESKKKVAGGRFICSCRGCLQQQVRVMDALCSYTADFFEP